MSARSRMGLLRIMALLQARLHPPQKLCHSQCRSDMLQEMIISVLSYIVALDSRIALEQRTQASDNTQNTLPGPQTIRLGVGILSCP